MKEAMMRGLLLLILFFPSFAVAGQNQYICEVFGEYSVTEAGIFNPIDSPFVGKSFTVDRDTGSVIGQPFATDKQGKANLVVHRGDKTGRFKLISTFTNPDIIQILLIDEPVDGKVKPFWGTDSRFVYTGLCE